MTSESTLNGPAALPSAGVPELGKPRTFHWTPGLAIGLALGALIVLTGVFAPLFLSERADTLSRMAGAALSAEHPFGTDDLGRDMLARSLVATRLTLIMTSAALLISAGLGILLGAGIWLAPRRLREFSLRTIETAVTMPGLIVALIITATLGAGATSVVLGIGIAGIPAFARMTANLASDVSRRDFVTMASLLGVPKWRIITRHMLPNIAEPTLIVLASGFAVSLIEISGLSFIGLGVQSPDYDYGKLLIDALPSIYTQPSQVLGPALMIVVTVLAAMLIGDGLAAAANPRSANARSGQGRRRPVQEPSPANVDIEQDLVIVDGLTITSAHDMELVHGVSFRVRRGEILGVVGESGSGKSLTAMALAQLTADGLDVTARRVSIGDSDMLGQVERGTLATLVAMVYQDPGTTFNPARRMGTQLTEVLRTHLGRGRSAARASIVESLRAVHMTDPETRLKQYPYQLSGGMRQRAMIASAMSTGAQLIIADEPTTALDVTVQAGILKEFKRINARGDASMLFVSHDISVVEALCDRVIVMKDGEIVEELTAQQLRDGDMRHSYTRMLVEATPRV